MPYDPITYVYKTLPSGLDLCLDVYLPPQPPAAGEAPLAILQWIHGGGLFIANRTGIAQHVKEAAATHHICVVSVDYRLAPQANLGDILEDVCDAATWIRVELPRRLPPSVVLNVEQLAIGGSSAGGYLALLTGHPTLGLLPPPRAIACMYPISNPLGSFFATPRNPSRRSEGGTISVPDDMAPYLDLSAPVLSGTLLPDPPPKGDRMELYGWTLDEGSWAKVVMSKPSFHKIEDFCAENFVGPPYPPVYFSHGVIDDQVGIEQSRELARLLSTHGVKHVYNEIPPPGAAHLFDIMNPKEGMERMYEFLLEQLE